MGFYNRNGNKLKINIKSMKYLSSGHCSKLVHDNEIVFKEYFKNTRKELRITKESFDYFKSIDNTHFIKLYDVYCNLDFIESIGLKFWNKIFRVDAYTTKYYEDDSVNILLEHKDYLLDNLKELEELFDRFSKDNVFLDDLKRANTIMSKNGIVIIDPDLFMVNPNLEELMGEDVYSIIGCKYNYYTENKIKLLGLLNDILTQAKYQMDYPNSYDYLSTINYINFNTKGCYDITSEVSKILKHVDKPIDYIRNR